MTKACFRLDLAQKRSKNQGHYSTFEMKLTEKTEPFEVWTWPNYAAKTGHFSPTKMIDKLAHTKERLKRKKRELYGRNSRKKEAKNGREKRSGYKETGDTNNEVATHQTQTKSSDHSPQRYRSFYCKNSNPTLFSFLTLFIF